MKSAVFSGSHNGLLALLLCLLAAVEFCASAPHHGSELMVRDDYVQLISRKPSAAVTAYRQLLQRGKTVPTNDQQWMDFTPAGEHILASDGFEGCVGIMIPSEKGVIIAHYTQTQDNVQTGKTEVTKLYNAHLNAVQGATPYVYAQVQPNNPSQYVEGTIVQAHIDWLKTLTGKTPVVQTYVEPLEIWVDQDGMPLDDADYDNMQYGAMLAQNQGGGSAKTNLIFITIDAQKIAAAPPDS